MDKRPIGVSTPTVMELEADIEQLTYIAEAHIATNKMLTAEIEQRSRLADDLELLLARTISTLLSCDKEEGMVAERQFRALLTKDSDDDCPSVHVDDAGLRQNYAESTEGSDS